MPTKYSRSVNDIALGRGDRVPSRRDAKDLIRLAFVQALPAGRYPAKEIAGAIGAAQSTVEGWRQPDGIMSADFLVILQVRYPQFDAELRRLFRLRRDLDPDFQRQLAEFVQQMQRGA